MWMGPRGSTTGERHESDGAINKRCAIFTEGVAEKETTERWGGQRREMSRNSNVMDVVMGSSVSTIDH